jgi:H+/Cl- antiporter ClcA
LPETGPAGAAAVSGAAFSSPVVAVLVSLEQALRNSNPHAAKLGKINLLIVYNLSFANPAI